jgi:hypothetical protein
MTDTRYPYTHACDFIRSIAGYGENGAKLSRSDASQIRSKIAEIIEMDDNLLACKLADYYLKNKDEIDNKSVEYLLKVFKRKEA